MAKAAPKSAAKSMRGSKAPAKAKAKLDLESLSALGAERIASLLLEAAESDAVLKRRLKFEVVMAGDPAAAAREIEKRIASLKRSQSFVDWPKMRDFANDLDSTRRLIAERLGVADPGAAYELMWSFLDSAPASFGRCDDSNGTVGGVYALALRDAGALAEKAAVSVGRVVERVFSSIEGNDYGQLDGVIDIFAPALGTAGIATLRQRLRETLAAAEAELASQKRKPEIKRYGGVAFVSRADIEAFRPEQRVRTLRYALQIVADIEGDVDAYVAAIEPETRKVPRIAIDIAQRLMRAGRPREALAALDAANAKEFAHFKYDLETARFPILDALGRKDEAQAGRWTSFVRTLTVERLRDYLSRLPDFEDFEAEQKALDHAEATKDIYSALSFLVQWKSLDRAARLVMTHAKKWNGERYEFLSPAAEALGEKHALAATVLLRAMIDDTLKHGRSSRYFHAARHLKECEAMQSRTPPDAPLPAHDAYVAGLRSAHARKTSFWKEAKAV